MSRRTLWAFIGLVVIAGGGLFLVRRGGDFAGSGSSGGGPNQFVAGMFSDLSTRNPWSYYGPNTTVWNIYASSDSYVSLFAYTTQRFDWVPMLASGEPTPLSIDDQGRWQSIVQIRDDAVWSDGTPITAADVAFTYHAIASLGANNLGGNFPTMAPADLLVATEAVDAHTLRFTLERRDARYKFGILMAPIFQRAFWEPHLQAALSSDDPLNAMFGVDTAGEPVHGPFLSGIWERGSFVNRPANPRYSERGSVERLYENGSVELVDGGGQVWWTGGGEPGGDVRLEYAHGPFVDALHYQIYGTQATGVLALQAGEVDYLYNPIGLEKGFQDQLRGVDDVTLVENATNGVRYLGFNFRRPPMDRLAFRQAVATLIEREFVTDRVLQGVAYPIFSMVPAGNAFWHNADVTVYGEGLSRGERIREAVRLLEADGFTWAERPAVAADGTLTRPGSGLRQPNGQPVPEFELLGPGDAYDPLRATFANWIERWLNEAGIPVRSNLTAFNIVSDRVFDQQDFDMWILGWSLSPYPSYLEAFFHSRHGGLNGHNATGYSSPEYDRAVDEFLQEPDDMDRARMLAFRLQELLARDLPYVVLFDTPIVEAYRADRVQFPTTTGLGGIQNQVMNNNGFLAGIQTIR